jgi:hypothetical protein
MRGLRSLVSLVLALALVASATIHGARAAGMAMPMAMVADAAAEAPCDLCGGGAAAEAAAHCALVCAGFAGVIGDPGLLRSDFSDRPTAGAPPTKVSHYAGPEPDPPR